jgi:4-diphosphocytidyl-2-C-methyl-D-erythritol kinase
MPAAVSARACAKINVTLRVTGVRADGYHELRTVFQSLELHDTLTCAQVAGPFRIECRDPGCPIDRANLVWQAAEGLWRAAGRRGVPRDTVVRIVKRIPQQSGLGGGSSDAAAAIGALTRLWQLRLGRDQIRAVAAGVGADVPYFLEGGTALGLDRGDLLFPLAEGGRQWVVLIVPAFGVSTKDAYGWFDAGARPRRSRSASAAGRAADRGPLPADEYRNDLQDAVAARHPEIGRLVRALERHGAGHAAMSGSGSTVFGLFDDRARANAAAAAVGVRERVLVTRTMSRARYASFSAPKLRAGNELGGPGG